jgi:signal transduction histidine kinase/DNA-binding response OmpR family regulator/ligand-binding sensor domain-containing protein
MSHKATLLIICFYLNYAHSLLSQNGREDYIVLSVNDGLSQGTIFDMHQCRQGYLWIATKDGLNRYDGYHFKVYTPNLFDPGTIGSDEILQIFEDSRGHLWLPHLKGMDLYMPDLDKFLHFSSDTLPFHFGMPTGISPLSFSEDKNGIIWITDYSRLWKIQQLSTQNPIKGNWEFQKEDFEIQEIAFPLTESERPIQVKTRDVYVSQKSEIFISTTNGLYRLNEESQIPEFLGLRGETVKIISEDKEGNLWLKVLPDSKRHNQFQKFPEMDDYYSDFRLFVWDGKGVHDLGIDLNYPSLLHIDQNNKLWAVDGKTLLNGNCNALLKGSELKEQITFDLSDVASDNFNFMSITTDRSGLIWLGMNGFGLVKYNINKKRFKSILPGQSHRSILACPDGKCFTYWEPEKLYLNYSFDSYITNPWVKKVRPNEVHFPFVFDADGNGWGLTRYLDLFRIDKITKSIKYLDKSCYGLIVSQNRNLFSVNDEGLLEILPSTERILLHKFPDDLALQASPIKYQHHLYESFDGTIWIYTFEGLIRAQRKDEGFEFKYYCNNPKDKRSLSNNAILCVLDDPLEPQNHLWIGTKGGGLNMLDKKTGIFSHFTTQEGLADNVVYGLLSDEDGNLWLSSNKGLSRVQIKSKIINNFTWEDGLQHNEFNTGSYFKSADGLMIFGGINGLTTFRPKDIIFNSVVPQTRIVGLTVGNKSKSFADGETLFFSYKENFIGLEFSSLDFINPLQNKYRYRLLKDVVFSNPGHGDWIDLNDQNSVQFANLSPGSYTFSVQGSNNDAIWSEDPALLMFVIKPPIWAQWWSFVLYALFFLFLVVLFYRFHLNRKIAHFEALRLQKLNEFKSRFYTNITHEFRTPLTVINGMAKQIREKPELYLQLGSRLIEENGNNLLKLVNQLLRISRLENDAIQLNYMSGDIVAHIRVVVESFTAFAESKNLNLSFSTTISSLLIEFDPEHLYQIISNIISNALKFTPSGGKIEVGLTIKEDGCLEISIKDTGLGISETDLPHIFDRFYQAANTTQETEEGSGIGLAYVAEIVQFMGGYMEVQSEVDKGAHFFVFIPIQDNKLGKIDIKAFSSFQRNNHELEHFETQEAREHNVNNEGQPMVLLIEDNAHLIIYIKSLLDADFKIITASNGKKGIEQAVTEIPDLIISDVMMPEKDGFEVCEFLKSDNRTSHIPIVLLTAKTDVKSRIEGLNRGADAYLSKPFVSEELFATINNIFSTRKVLQERIFQLVFNSKTPPSSEKTNIPDLESETTTVLETENDFVQKLKKYIIENMDQTSLSMEELSQYMLMSYQNLYKKLTSTTGMSPVQFVRLVRIKEAEKLLLTTDSPVREIALRVGFSDPRYFSRLFTEELGKTPSAVRKAP